MVADEVRPPYLQALERLRQDQVPLVQAEPDPASDAQAPGGTGGELRRRPSGDRVLKGARAGVLAGRPERPEGESQCLMDVPEDAEAQPPRRRIGTGKASTCAP